MKKLNKRNRWSSDAARDMLNRCACKAYRCACNSFWATEHGSKILSEQVRMNGSRGAEPMGDMK